MKKFHTGERVIVPWGLGEAEGMVVDSFGRPGNVIVTVRIDFLQDDEADMSSDIGFRADDVRPAPAVAHG